MAKPIKLPSGNWRIRWIDENGKRRSESLTSKKDAELRLKEVEVQAERVRRGLERPQVTPMTFAEASDLWIALRTKQKRTPKDDLSIIRAHLKPFFGDMILSRISVKDTDAYSLSRNKLSSKTIHNHLTLLKSILKYMFELGHLEVLPVIKKPKIRLINNNYTYLRTDEEIHKFLKAANSISKFAYEIYHFAIYSGMRKGEIVGLKWSDIDLERRLITVQRSFNKPTKSGETRYVPILDQNLDLLISIKRESNSQFVFPASDRGMLKSWNRVFNKDFNASLKISGLGDGKKKYIVLHSLRHTFASNWVKNEGDLFKLQKILGHKDMKMTQIYAHLCPDVYKENWGIFNKDHYISNQAKVVHLFNGRGLDA